MGFVSGPPANGRTDLHPLSRRILERMARQDNVRGRPGGTNTPTAQWGSEDRHLEDNVTGEGRAGSRGSTKVH